MRVNTRLMTNRMRRMMTARHWLASSALALIAIFALGSGILAGGWCRSDPIVEINGEEVQVWVSIPDGMKSAVNGPVQVQFGRPWNGHGHVKYVDHGFNGHGETVSFFDSNGPNPDGSFNVDIFVVVPVDTTKLPDGVWEVPVELKVVTDNGTKTVYGSHWWTATQVTVGG